MTLLLELENTLLPVATDDGLDAPATSLFEALDRVGVQVIVVSGRERASVESLRSSGKKAWWLAERGAWKYDGVWTGPPATPELDQLARSLGPLATRPERRAYSVTATSRDASVREAITRACDAWLEHNPLYVVIHGAEAIEVRHRSISRVAAVSWIRGRVPNAHVLAIGDDLVDDDVFGGLREDEIGIAAYAVGGRRSGRRPWLAGSAAVRAFLWWLVEARIANPTWTPPLGAAS